ncbi:MAG TPA: flagellar FlbD family protein [Bryobacteraceae bacterium]|jgi:flagellar protein FlbD|nr:flagellar FlbD family protein [Bryobacteraceae bacterium]
MIKLTRLNQVPLYLNSDLIEHIDSTPDTVVSLISGQKFLVSETPEEVVEKIIAFRKAVLVDSSAHLAGARHLIETCAHAR